MTDLKIIDPATEGVEPTGCRWPPRKAPDSETAIYERLRERIVSAHCAADRGAHQCCGKITLDRQHITLSCRLCGDARLNLT